MMIALEECFLTTALFDKISFEIVTIEFGSTEDQCTIHFEFINGMKTVFTFENLRCFRESFYDWINDEKRICLAMVLPFASL